MNLMLFITSNWNFSDDLLFTKKINDIYPATDPVFPDRNHTITGRKTFRGRVIIQGDADIHVVNGINLRNISKIVLKHGDYDITGEKVYLSSFICYFMRYYLLR